MVADPIKLKEFFDLGFTVVPDALTQEQVANIVADLERLGKIDNEWLEQREKETGQIQPDKNMVLNPVLRSRNVAELLENDVMHDYLDEILGNTCIMYANQSSSMPPSGSNYSSRIHVDSPRFIPDYVTNLGAFYALTDFTLENGATWYLPGSHKMPDMPDEAFFVANAARPLPKAGDLVIFNARTWHRGGANLTDRPRHAMTFNICRSYMRQRFDYPRMVVNMKSDVLDWVGARGKRMLGYNVRMPASHEEFYVPEDQRLYKGGQG